MSAIHVNKFDIPSTSVPNMTRPQKKKKSSVGRGDSARGSQSNNTKSPLTSHMTRNSHQVASNFNTGRNPQTKSSMNMFSTPYSLH